MGEGRRGSMRRSYNMHVAPLADNRTLIGHREIGSNNAITKDHPRLENTAKPNAR